MIRLVVTRTDVVDRGDSMPLVRSATIDLASRATLADLARAVHDCPLFPLQSSHERVFIFAGDRRLVRLHGWSMHRQQADHFFVAPETEIAGLVADALRFSCTDLDGPVRLFDDPMPDLQCLVAQRP